jgi:hypothetical protein
LGLNITLSLEPKVRKKLVEVHRFQFPCSLLLDRFRIQIDHPATPQDQIQAAAVTEGCDWCPFFDQTAYREIGTRIVEESVFE